MILLIGIIILTVLNLIIYHKIFNIYYLGGVGKGCLSEIIGAWMIALLEIALLKIIGGYIIFAIVIIAIIVAVIRIIKKIYDKRLDIENAFNTAKDKAENFYDKKNKCEKNTTKPTGEDTSPLEPTTLPNAESKQDIPLNDDAWKENAINANKDISGQDYYDTAIKIESVNADSNKMFCTSCGQKILRTVKFCNYCGSIVLYKA